MSVSERTAASVAQTLRDEFDRGFAVPVQASTAAIEDFLMLRVAGDPYAIALRDVVAIHATPSIVDLPSARADVAGVTGVRGRIVPAFSLPAILGYSKDTARARWIVVSDAADPIAFTFSDFDGHLRVSQSQVHDEARSRDQRLRRVVHTDGGNRPVIDLAVVVADIRARSALHRQRSSES